MKHNKHLVVLDARSPIGITFLEGHNEGVTKQGHPALDCIEIDTSDPHYLACTRQMSSKGKSHQSLLVPHHAVAYVIHYAREEDRQLGFGSA
ncbi:MAG TPA: hypothetical protein VGE56_02115 [Rhodocyclaceae bacterium]